MQVHTVLLTGLPHTEGLCTLTCAEGAYRVLLTFIIY